MKTIYIPGDALTFKAYIDAHYTKGTVKLHGIDGNNRWVVTEGGEEFIVRPEETKPQ